MCSDDVGQPVATTQQLFVIFTMMSGINSCNLVLQEIPRNVECSIRGSAKKDGNKFSHMKTRMLSHLLRKLLMALLPKFATSPPRPLEANPYLSKACSYAYRRCVFRINPHTSHTYSAHTYTPDHRSPGHPRLGPWRSGYYRYLFHLRSTVLQPTEYISKTSNAVNINKRTACQFFLQLTNA